jgi:hypothetical protein
MTPTKTHQQASKQCKKVYKVPEDVHVETIDEITYVTLEGSDTIVDWFRNICIFKKTRHASWFFCVTQTIV